MFSHSKPTKKGIAYEENSCLEALIYVQHEVDGNADIRVIAAVKRLGKVLKFDKIDELKENN